ncbi:hypothetical protein ACHAQA_008936 [Verticillium albo-atrum]
MEGTLTVKFRNSVLPVTLTGVPTLNISHWGQGNYRGLVDHALFDLDADASFLKIQPRLGTLARTVLAQGEPVAPPTPCSAACTYSMRIDGPGFNCKEIDAQKFALFEPCTGKIFESRTQSVREGLRVFNNSLVISWHTELIAGEKCDNTTLRTMECSVSLATYDIRITNEENGTRTFDTKMAKEQDIWNDETPIELSFYDYFFDRTVGELRETAANKSQLHEVFANTQTYAISQAAVQAIEGSIVRFVDGGGDSLAGGLIPNETLAVASPYIGMVDRFHPKVHLSPKTMQAYIQDVVISIISLNPRDKALWTNGPDIEGLEGGETFVFDAQVQFYAPYAACLLAGAVAYAVGIWALWKNGEPAGKSFLQFVTAMVTSKALQDLSEKHNAQEDGEATQKLNNLKLRYGVGRSSHGNSGGYVAGFGTVDELD